MMRQSGIELLRIVSMLMVLNVHTFIPADSLTWHTLDARTFIDFFREATSISSVNLFILISGFFSIRWKKRGFVSLVYQVFFFIFFLYVLMYLTGRIDFSVKELLKRINCLYSAYWFIPAYLGLYFLAPVLNAFVEKLSAKELFYFLSIFYFIQFYYQLFNDSNFNSGYSILSFCGLYLIGRYLHNINLASLKQSKLILVAILLTVIIAILPILAQIYLHKDHMGIKTGFIFGFIYNNPFVLLQSVCIFVIFAKMTFQSGAVNFLASSALAIYLVHMHPDMKAHYTRFAQDLYSYSLSYQIMMLITLFAGVFIVAVLLDYVRRKSFSFIYDSIEKKTNKKCIAEL